MTEEKKSNLDEEYEEYYRTGIPPIRNKKPNSLAGRSVGPKPEVNWSGIICYIIFIIACIFAAIFWIYFLAGVGG